MKDCVDMHMHPDNDVLYKYGELWFSRRFERHKQDGCDAYWDEGQGDVWDGLQI